MRFYNYLTENSSYNNWTFPSQDTMEEDFREYKKKEDKKGENRAKMIGSRFPIFQDFQHFKESLENADVVKLTSSLDKKIMNRSRTNSIEELEELVGGYKRPRDVGRIVKGFEEDDKIPYPIVIKGDKGMWIMAGNTRLDAAFLMGVKPKVLMVDVSGE